MLTRLRKMVYHKYMTHSQGTPHTEKRVLQFDPNPFTLTYKSFIQAYKINQNPLLTILIGSVVIGVVGQVVNVILQLMPSSSNGDAKASAIEIVIALFILFVFAPLQLLFAGFWTGFCSLIGLKSAYMRSIDTMAAAKYALRKLLKVLGLTLIIGFTTISFVLPAVALGIVGIILQTEHATAAAIILYVLAAMALIVGVVYSARYSLSRSLSVYALLDEQLSISDAMKRSKQLTRSRLIEIWGMTFAGSVIPVVSSALIVCCMSSHYVQLKTYVDAKAALPPRHIASWLPVAVLGFVLFLVLAAGLIIGLALLANN